MTIDDHIMNRYSLSNYVPTQFHKLFDNNNPYIHNAANMLHTKRHPFQFNSFQMGMLNNERGFSGAQLWKNSVSMPYFPLQQFPPLKYLPQPTSSLDMLNNYLPGPNSEMIKYVEKIREDELTTKMKDNPEAKLCEDDLWKRFNGLTTEMVITKSGRRMFPAFKVQLSGLDPKSKYVLALEMMPCDDNRFKFHNGKWTLAGKADPESSRLIYPHCESPATGDSWMQKAVWFNKVKLTNNPTDKDPQHLVLNSMHKYVMRLHIFRVDDTSKVRFCLYPEVFVFRTTEFIAVTAYQNDKITQLKIDNNPFAKGFRDNGSGRREKKRFKYQQTITSTSPDSPVEFDDEIAVKEEEIQKLSIESFSITNKSNFLNIEIDKETSHDSPISSSSSQSHEGNKPSRSSKIDSAIKSSDLKRKYTCVSPVQIGPSKKRGHVANNDRRSTTIKYQSEDMNACLRGPHTVHYTPRRFIPQTLDFMDNVNHNFEQQIPTLKPSWNIWQASKMEPSYSLQMMSKLCRMMTQQKGNQISSYNNENLMKTFNNMWLRNNRQFITEDQNEKQISSPTYFDTLGRTTFFSDHDNSQDETTKIEKKTSSSTFNISSLL